MGARLRMVRLMSLEEFFGGPGAPEFLHIFSTCLQSIGTPGFNARFLELIEQVIKADQCMVFSYKTPRPQCYLTYNERHAKGVQNMVQTYLRDGFKQDPSRAAIEQVRETGEMVIATMDQTDGDEPFAAAGIGDRLTVIARRDEDVIAMNFFRFKENGRFSVSETQLRLDFWNAIAQTVLLHFSDRNGSKLQSPLNSLSAREKEICEGMLRGLTADAIAWELDVAPSTVMTYRKRAYEKLGINSKSALFMLCNTGS